MTYFIMVAAVLVGLAVPVPAFPPVAQQLKRKGQLTPATPI